MLDCLVERPFGATPEDRSPAEQQEDRLAVRVAERVVAPATVAIQAVRLPPAAVQAAPLAEPLAVEQVLLEEDLKQNCRPPAGDLASKHHPDYLE